MIIESSSSLVKSQLSKLLITFRAEPQDREGIVLDIIEFIAQRLPRADDDEVFNLAVFVSASLKAFLCGAVAYPDVHSRLARAALTARLGPTEFLKSLDVG